MNFNALIRNTHERTVGGQTLANTSRIIPNMIRHIEVNRSYLVVGHGSHIPGNYFVVPNGTYVVFFSSPGVALSSALITNAKFNSMLRNPFSVAQFLAGTLPRNSLPDYFRYSRSNFNWKKLMYAPRTNCPNLHIEMRDTTQPLNTTTGTGVLQQYMGVWKLPTSTRSFVNETKTLSEILSSKGPGVYFIYSCRGSPSTMNWGSTNEVYRKARTVLPNLQTYNAYLGNRMNTPNLKSRYILHVRSNLQNRGRLNLLNLFPENERVSQHEQHVHRMTFRKRVHRMTFRKRVRK